MYEKHAPVIHRDGLTVLELAELQSLVALADSATGQYLIISGGEVAQTTAQWTVPFGGTGVISLTPYALITGGTSSTGAMQQVSGVGSSGQVLTSNGAGALPTWQDSTGGSGGGFTRLTATGIINSINADFTFTEKPDYIVSDGAWYEENSGWTWSGSTATMTIPPNDSIYGFT